MGSAFHQAFPDTCCGQASGMQWEKDRQLQPHGVRPVDP